MEEVVKILNKKQVALYVKNNVKPIDISVSTYNYGQTDVLVFTFLKEDTKEVWELWKNYNLK